MNQNPPRILLTRTPRAAAQLIDELIGELGENSAQIVCVPVREAELVAGELLKSALSTLESLANGAYEAVTFTSANGVRAFNRLCFDLPAQPQPSEVLGSTHLASVGTATARKLEKLGVSVALVPEVQDARHMVEQWSIEQLGARVLCVQGANAQDTLSRGLAEKGCSVQVATVYQMSDYPAPAPLDSGHKTYRGLEPLSLETALASTYSGEPEILVATAPSFLRTLHAAWQAHPSTFARDFPAVVAMGASTAEQAEYLNLSYRVAPSPTPHDLAQTALSFLTSPQ